MANYTNTGYQANVNQGQGSGVQTMVNGRWMDSASPEAMRQQTQTQNALTTQGRKFVDAQNAAESAELDQQEVEDRISENKARNQGMTALAFGNAQRGGQLGRGLFQRRQAGTKIGAALGSLATANASGLKAARMKTLKSRQAADPARMNPALGYQAAMAGLYKQLA